MWSSSVCVAMVAVSLAATVARGGAEQGGRVDSSALGAEARVARGIASMPPTGVVVAQGVVESREAPLGDRRPGGQRPGGSVTCEMADPMGVGTQRGVELSSSKRKRPGGRRSAEGVRKSPGGGLQAASCSSGAQGELGGAGAASGEESCCVSARAACASRFSWRVSFLRSCVKWQKVQSWPFLQRPFAKKLHRLHSPMKCCAEPADGSGPSLIGVAGPIRGLLPSERLLLEPRRADMGLYVEVAEGSASSSSGMTKNSSLRGGGATTCLGWKLLSAKALTFPDSFPAVPDR
mmetsp:Transcript_23424/g.52076  ORF Transcript_23424/g.52076 Transcript_23424/m.52076 type:complete len:292 (+) Transcript_23424:255-1130(+)